MTITKFHDPQTMTQIAELFSGLKDLDEKFEGEFGDNDSMPLYILSTEIVIAHKDGYTIGRIGMEDGYLFFELTDEYYGEKPKETS